MLRGAGQEMSRAVFKLVMHSSALTLKGREAERTYSSPKRRKTLPSALKPASSHLGSFLHRHLLLCSPVPHLLPRPKPLLLTAATRTATTARRRGGEAVDPKGLNLRTYTKHKG